MLRLATNPIFRVQTGKYITLKISRFSDFTRVNMYFISPAGLFTTQQIKTSSPYQRTRTARPYTNYSKETVNIT